MYDYHLNSKCNVLEEEENFWSVFRNPGAGAAVRGIWVRVPTVWYQSREMFLRVWCCLRDTLIPALQFWDPCMHYCNWHIDLHIEA